MVWTNDHDEMLCREILVQEPYNYKPNTPQRGEIWKNIAAELNENRDMRFSVSHRSVRERYNLIARKFKSKNSQEEKQSGIAPDELSDLEKALEEIIEKFKEAEANYVLEKDLENKKNEEERTCAQEMRTAAMETYAESKKRKGDLEEAEGKKKRRRNSGNETVAYLREKFELQSWSKIMRLTTNFTGK